MTALEETKKALESVGPLKVEFTPDCDEFNAIIAPINDDYDGTFFTVIGCGDKQDKLGGFMAVAVNAVPELLSTLESLQHENDELRKRGDGAANMATQMAADCSNAQRNLAELRSAIGPINALLAHLLSMSVYHITNPPTADWEFVQVCNGDLRKMIELSDAAEYALASTGGEHHAE